MKKLFTFFALTVMSFVAAFAAGEEATETAKATIIVNTGEENELEPVEGATVTFMGKEYVTPQNGTVEITIPGDPEKVVGTTIEFTAYKDGYEFYEGVVDFSEGFEGWAIATLTPMQIPFSINVVDPEWEPVEGAVVTVDGKEYTTDEQGKVFIGTFNGPDVMFTEVEYTVVKDLYHDFKGVAVFDGNDVNPVAELDPIDATLTVYAFQDNDEDFAVDATVEFEDEYYTIGENGRVEITLPAPKYLGKTFPILVRKDGYETVKGEVEFGSIESNSFVAYLEAAEATLNIKVMCGDDPVADAYIVYDGKEYYSDEMGSLVVKGIYAPAVVGTKVPVTVYKDGYTEYKGEADFSNTTDAYFIAYLEAEEGTFTVKVFCDNEPVEGATVTFLDKEYTTDETGEAKATGLYAPAIIGTTVPYTVYKDGYTSFEGEADFTEGFDAFEIAEIEAEKGSFTVKVVTGEENDPVEGATVTFDGKEYTTDANGEVKVTELYAPDFVGKAVPYTVYKDGYAFFEGEADFTETMDAYEVAELVVDNATLTVKVVTGEENDPVEGATVTFDGEEYTTDANGEVKITGINALEVLGKTVPYTVYKDGYAFFEGEADFTETIDANEVVVLEAAMASLTVKVVTGEENDPVEGATVTFLGTEYTTDANGEVKITDINFPEVFGQTIAVTVTKEGYEDYEGEADFTETMDAYVVVELTGIKTGIDAIISDIQNSDAKVYDLNGRRVVNPQSGRVYIVNGQKVLLNR